MSAEWGRAEYAGDWPSDGSYSYTWDAESRMKSGAGVNYSYDGDGRRVQKSNGKLYWYGAGAEPLLETNLSGGNEEEYIFFGGKRIARRVVSSSTVFYYFADHLGTSRVIVQAGATAACYEADYLPYGKERVITNTCPQNYKFTGKERDTGSNLDYFGARYYSSASARFMTPDWSEVPQPVPYADLGDPQTLNLYSYAGNNPMTRTDPDGHFWDTLLDIAFVTYSASAVVASYITQSEELDTDLKALKADTLGLAVPGVTGLGNAVRAARAAENAVDAAKALDKVGDATRLSGKAEDVASVTKVKLGEVYVTEPQQSGKPYVGRTTQGTEQRMRTRTDGRTGKARVVDRYDAKNTREGRFKEQKQVDKRGGVKKLDIKRNEVSKKNMKKLEKESQQ